MSIYGSLVTLCFRHYLLKKNECVVGSQTFTTLANDLVLKPVFYLLVLSVYLCVTRQQDFSRRYTAIRIFPREGVIVLHSTLAESHWYFFSVLILRKPIGVFLFRGLLSRQFFTKLLLIHLTSLAVCFVWNFSSGY